MTEQELIKKVCRSAPFATLALHHPETGFPAVVPVNFVLEGDSLYFHGKRSGRKMTLMGNDPRVGISIVKDYGIIPSYFSTDD
ncbi:pyridoxamine 5'-phosphate oxidase family protein [Nitratifractor salsuginis]|uniref:pyridoxamine 5'-phosphate oxidase family protein n=1 Tax=Nitratifractor salsuginis TaxID=269261 RepID=UPI0002F4CA98|nr:pyridoxamine 5'-phosphate oxidase family protein [Nitratifractor salsuginis]